MIACLLFKKITNVIASDSSEQRYMGFEIAHIFHDVISRWDVRRIADEEERLGEIPHRIKATPFSECHAVCEAMALRVHPCDLKSF